MRLDKDQFRKFVKVQESEGRFVAGVFGVISFLVGLLVVVWMCSQPLGEFGSPPLFIRLFFSLIAVAFMAAVGTTVWGVFFGPRLGIGSLLDKAKTLAEAQDQDSAKPGSYNCGATLKSDAEVSPHGDVKRSFCDARFNLYGRSPPDLPPHPRSHTNR